jgi:hypothetical protein
MRRAAQRAACRPSGACRRGHPLLLLAKERTFSVALMGEGASAEGAAAAATSPKCPSMIEGAAVQPSAVSSAVWLGRMVLLSGAVLSGEG